MNKALLDLQGADELVIAGEADQPISPIQGTDFRYDFEEKRLIAQPNDQQEKPSPYIISKELANAVNAAIITGRPLLLKGEPGCGKTQLAKAVAWYFYEKGKNEINDPEEQKKLSLKN